MIAENGWRDAAAVASRRAGELYGLDVLDEDIQVSANECASVCVCVCVEGRNSGHLSIPLFVLPSLLNGA